MQDEKEGANLRKGCFEGYRSAAVVVLARATGDCIDQRIGRKSTKRSEVDTKSCSLERDGGRNDRKNKKQSPEPRRRR